MRNATFTLMMRSFILTIMVAMLAVAGCSTLQVATTQPAEVSVAPKPPPVQRMPTRLARSTSHELGSSQRPSLLPSPTSDLKLNKEPAEGSGPLQIIYPTGDSELVGGQTVRLTVLLTDHAGEGVGAADITATVRTPAGAEYLRLDCEHAGQGRYMSSPFSLPLRDSEGEWTVYYSARSSEGQASLTGSFASGPSYSERLEEMWGFWMEFTDLFAYHVPQAPEPEGRFHPYEDGNGGTVLFANTFPHGQVYQDFVMLDIHWRGAKWPVDDTGAIAIVQQLKGPHLQDLVLEPDALSAVQVLRHGRPPGWRVHADWESTPENGNPVPGGTVEWDLVDCPGSQWIWTVVVATNQQRYLPELRANRETFRCPAAGSGPAG